MFLGLDQQVGVQVLGQGPDGGDDHAGLLDPQVTGRRDRPGPGRRCPGRSRGARPLRLRLWSAGSGARTSSRSTSHRRRCRPGPRRHARRPGLQLHDLGFETGQLDQGRRCFGGAHGPHGCVDHTVRDRAHVRGRRSHLVVGCGHRGHGSTQALTTDSQRPRSRLSTGFQVTNRSRSAALVHTPVGVCGGGFEARAWRPSHLNHRGSGGRKAGGGPQPPARRTRPCCLRRPTRTDPQVALIAPSSCGWFRGSGLAALAPQPPGLRRPGSRRRTAATCTPYPS